MSTARLTGWRTRSDGAESVAFFECALAGPGAGPNPLTARHIAAKNVDNFLIMITPEKPGATFRMTLKASRPPRFFASFLMPARVHWLASDAGIGTHGNRIGR